MIAVLAGCGAASSPSAGTAAATAENAGPLTLRTVHTRTFDLATDMLGVRGLARSASGLLAFVADGATTATIVVLDPASGQVRWEVPVKEVGKGYLHASGLGFADENVVLGGQFTSELAVSDKLTLASGGEAGFVLRFDKAGKLLAENAISGYGVSIPNLAVDASGAALVGGAFQRNAHIGGKTLAGTGAGNGVSGSLFVTRLGPTGAPEWATEIRGRAYVDHVVDGGAGRVLVAGDFFGTFTSAGRTFSGRGSEGRGHYLAALDAKGDVQWADDIGVDAIAPVGDGSGDVAICVHASGKGHRSTLVVMEPDGRKRLERELDIEHCSSVAPGAGGRTFVCGDVELPPAADGSSRSELRVIELDAQGATIAGVPLPFRTAPSTDIALVPDGRGGVFVAGSFIDVEKKQGKVLVHHVGR